MYELIYWTENQNKISGTPKHYQTNDREDFIHALDFVNNNKFEIEYATEL